MTEKIKKHLKISIAVFVVTILLIFTFIVYMRKMWFFLPTESSPHELTITVYKKDYKNKSSIMIKNYENDKHICDYNLEIESGIYIEEPQTYDLPKFDKGETELTINLGSEEDVFTLKFNDAADFYKNGLLIYLTEGKPFKKNVNETSYERYIYFVSGKEKICYAKDIDSSEWAVLINPPSLKGYKIRELYSPIINEPAWKQNKWVKVFEES